MTLAAEWQGICYQYVVFCIRFLDCPSSLLFLLLRLVLEIAVLFLACN
jgi:hypothetical protein